MKTCEEELQFFRWHMGQLVMPTVTDLPSAQKGNLATRQNISTNAVCGFFFKFNLLACASAAALARAAAALTDFGLQLRQAPLLDEGRRAGGAPS